MYATVEVATLADAVNKASRFAPVKGTALDRAGGIVLELASSHLIVRATDLESTFRQQVPLADSDGSCVWRVSSALLTAIVGKLPMPLGALVTLEAKPGDIWLHCAAEDVSAKMRLYDRDLAYPMWKPFDVGLLKPVEDFNMRVQQVAWAAQTKGDLLTGIHISGTHVVACDGVSVASTQLSVPVEEPVTARVQDVSWLLKTHPEVMLRAEKDHMQLALDQDTQITLRLFLGAYPAFGPFLNPEDYPKSVHLERDPVRDAIQRVWAPFEDKFPILDFHLTGTELVLAMEDEEVGRVEQRINVDCADPIHFKMSPAPTLAAITAARQQDVVMRHLGEPLKRIMFDDCLDYLAVTMPRALH